MHARRTLLAAAVLALPLLSVEGQQRRRPVQTLAGAPPISATELLDARRQLDLTPRQVARLDSIERSQVTQRRSFMQQMQKQRDSVCANRDPCRLSDEEREAFRNRQGRNGVDSFRRSDSLGRSLAFSLLDSTQRGRVQGWRQGERRAMMARGRMAPEVGPRGMGRGWREQGARRPRGPQSQGFGPRGSRRDDFGPRMRRPGMPRDDMEPGPRGMRRDNLGGPGGGMRFGPPDMPAMPRRPMRPRGPEGDRPEAPQSPVRPDSVPDSTR
jgi:hypothetical protein